MVGLFWYAASSSAQLWTEVPVPPPSGLDEGSLFGWSVVIDENLLLVGAPGANDPGANSGAVYVFSRNAGGVGQWEEVQRLQATGLNNGARFGSWMEWRNGILLVGAPFDAVNGLVSGSIYAFKQNTDGQFEEWQRIVPAFPQSNMRFGEHFDSANTSDVPLLLMTAAPGADCDPDYTQNCLGAVQLFADATGEGFDLLDDYCPPSSLSIFSLFARRAALVVGGDEARAVVAINGKLMSTTTSMVSSSDGVDGSEWPRTDTLTMSDVWGAPIIGAGSEITAGAGAFYAAALTGAHRIVASYILVTGQIVQDGMLLPDTTVIDLPHRFGHSIAANSNSSFSDQTIVAVGAPGADIGMPVGACILYQQDPTAEGNWGTMARLVPSDAEMGALFGSAVALSWPYVAVGAPGHGLDDRGKVYVFEDPTTAIRDRASNVPTVRISPVPTSDVLQVVLSAAHDRRADYSVLDSRGMELLSGPLAGSHLSIDVRGLSSGPYILRVIHDGSASHERFVIAR